MEVLKNDCKFFDTSPLGGSLYHIPVDLIELVSASFGIVQ